MKHRFYIFNQKFRFDIYKILNFFYFKNNNFIELKIK